MELRFLGRSGLQVSALGYGAMTFGDPDNPGMFPHLGVTESGIADRLVSICLDAGVTLFDTADVYTAGRSEEILGAALGARRKDAILATKAYGRMGPAAHDVGLSRRHLVAACEDSLRRLGTDWIDLYQVHSFDALVPLEETLRALDTLVTSGKVRYIGCSNYAAWQLMKALAVSEKLHLERFVGQQIQYSLMVRDVEHELLPCGADQGVGALIWSPLAQGFLSGKYRQGSGDDSRLQKSGRLNAFDTPHGQVVIDAVLKIAEAHDVSASQVALNWLLARPCVATVLVGARSEAQLRDNLAAASWSLTPAEIVELDTASQVPAPYPNSHHRMFSKDRHPQIFTHYRGKS